MEVLREGNDESHGGRQACDRCKCCKQGVAGRAEIVVCQLCQGNAPVFRDLVVVETHRTEIDGCKVDDADQDHSDDAGLGEKDGCLALLSDAERMDGGDDGDAECQSCEGVHVLYPSRKPLVIACVVYPAAACCPDVLPSGLMKARRKMMKSMTKNAGLSSLPMVLTMPFS